MRFSYLLYPLLGILGLYSMFHTYGYSSDASIHQPSSRDRGPCDSLISVIEEIGPKVAKNLGIRHLGESGIISTSKSKIGPVFRIIGRKVELQEARKLALPIIQEYRKLLAEDERVQEYFRTNQPDYNLQEQLFPLEFTYVRIEFGNRFFSYNLKEPLITSITYNTKTFRYWSYKKDSKKYTDIFEESFEEAVIAIQSSP